MSKSANQELISRLQQQVESLRNKHIVQLTPPRNTSTDRISSIIVFEDGSRILFRKYPIDDWLESPSSQLRKEKRLQQLLQNHGVPTANILAAIDLPGEVAALIEYLPGDLLGKVTQELSEPEIAQAWRSCGETFRQVHTIFYPPGTSGYLVGDEARPFYPIGTPLYQNGPYTWEDYWIDSIVRTLKELLKLKQGITVHLDELQTLLLEARPFLNTHTSTLLHYNADPWSILVQSTVEGWQCSGWLNWQNALVGDPTLDLVWMSLLRCQPIGPIPPAFWDGYGSYPSEPARSIYEMEIYLRAAAYWSNYPRFRPTYEAAIRYIGQFSTHMREIRRFL